MADRAIDKEIRMSAATFSVSALRKGSLRAGLRVVAVFLLVVGALAAFVGQANASVEIHNFSVTRSTTQAGGHPNLSVSFEPDYWLSPQLGLPCQCNDPKNIDVEFPAGLIGNPHATPQCTAAEFIRQSCPSDSQVGEVTLAANVGGNTVLGPFHLPLFNLVPKPSQAGLIAWEIPIFEAPVYSVLSARTGSDYGLNAFTDGVLQRFSIVSIKQELWGVPAEPANDQYRVGIPNYGGGGEPSGSPLSPFLSNPTTCGGSLVTSMHVLAYDEGETEANSSMPATTGCDQLSFNPSLSAQPTTDETDSASGLEVDLSVPQQLSPNTPSPSELRAVTVELPEGFSINPNAADGKASCLDAEARFGTEDEARCPEYSKIGTDTLESSALPAPLPGAIYIGEPQPGNRYRIFLTADGFATHVKLAGTVSADPSTGQLTVSFDNLPQSPLTDFNLHFFGSERGLLATPTQCGSYSVHSTFTPWDESLASQEATQFFTLVSGPGGTACPSPSRPFAPSFRAASVSNSAGAHTPFWIELARNDGDQNLSGVSVSPPPGLLATLKGVPYCPDTALMAAASSGYSGLVERAAPSCPTASQIGVAMAGAGAGSHPVYLPGKVYLAGPYKGAPLSLAVITPAVSGPYDLGDVVVRAAIEVDPATAQITVVSDPLPRILQGIPLRLRSILINLDRSGFTLNPTDCEPFSVGTQVVGDQGAQANLAAPFQVSNCARLPFGPKLSLKLNGGLNRLGHPAIHAVLTTKSGEANNHSVAVTLPKGEILDNAHIGNVCTKVRYAANTCPASSVLGTAEASTPLLDQPLKGTVYLRSGARLPDLAIDLKGQIDVELVGHIDTANGGALRTTFENVPDALVSSFSLDLAGGSKGLLQNSHSLCVSPKRATVKMTGQNGAVVIVMPRLQVSCHSQAARSKRQRHLNRRRGVH